MKTFLIAVFSIATCTAYSQTLGYQRGVVQSWKNVNLSCSGGDDCERRYDVISGNYVYRVTHALTVRSFNKLTAIGARDPLKSISPGAQIELRIDGKRMYILDHKNKEAAYSIDEVSPAR